MRLRELCPAVRANVLKKLRAEWSLARKVQRANFPVAGSFSVGGNSIAFYPEKEIEARKLASAVGKLFGVNGWKKVFSEWGGSWSYQATTSHELSLQVSSAPQPKNCQVVKRTYLATKYESLCKKEDKNA